MSLTNTLSIRGPRCEPFDTPELQQTQSKPLTAID